MYLLWLLWCRRRTAHSLVRTIKLELAYQSRIIGAPEASHHRHINDQDQPSAITTRPKEPTFGAQNGSRHLTGQTRAGECHSGRSDAKPCSDAAQQPQPPRGATLPSQRIGHFARDGLNKAHLARTSIQFSHR